MLIKSSFVMASMLLFVLPEIAVGERECDIIKDMECGCQSKSLECKVETKIDQISVTTRSKRFHTIRLNFLVNNFIVKPSFFKEINGILAKGPRDNEIISVHITFRYFDVLILEEYAFANIFNGITQNLTRLSIDFYSSKRVEVFPLTFANLSVGYLEFYGDEFTSDSAISFELLFNETFVSQVLRLEGVIINHDPKLVPSFNGSINRLLVSKQVKDINAIEYPDYPVKFYSIFAHNARDIQSESFKDYKNLRGLLIFSGQLKLSGNVLSGFAYLEELMLDLELIDNGALSYIGKNLTSLTLGAHIKHVDNTSIASLTSLTRLNVRELDFSLLSYPTRCAIADYVNRHRDVDFLFEQRHCECHLLFIVIIKQKKNMCTEKKYIEECARWAQCDFVRDYFIDLKKLSENNDNGVILVNSSYLKSLNEQNIGEEGPMILDIHVNLSDHVSNFWLPTTDETHAEIRMFTSEKPLTSLLVEPAFSVQTTTGSSHSVGNYRTENTQQTAGFQDLYDWPSNENGAVRKATGDLGLNWIPVVVICIALIISLTVALGVWYLNYRRRRGQFKPVPTTQI